MNINWNKVGLVMMLLAIYLGGGTIGLILFILGAAIYLST